MKAKKLIINGEEQNLSQVFSVNGQTGDVEVSGAIVPVVSEYPSNPVDGEMVIYQASLQIYYNNQWVLITVLGQ